MRKAVAVVIRNDEGKVLLALRGSYRGESGVWENVGGEISEGETKEDAVRRECREGIGVELVDLKETYTREFQGKETWEVTVFMAKPIGEPKIMEPEFCADLKWFALEELKNLPLASYTRADFESLGWIKS